MGTPDLAAAVLRRLVRWPGGDVVAVYTQPDRPAGRGHKLTPSPVKKLALELGLPVHQPLNFRQEGTVDELAALKPDLLVVAAYGLILPQAVLDIPTVDTLNVHTSLLPRYRGAAPIQRAVMENWQPGDVTGVSIMRIVPALDAGPVYAQCEVPIGEHTAGSLHDALAEAGGELLVTVLDQLRDGSAQPREQDESRVTYAAKLTKEDGYIDWDRPAAEVHARIRGVTPWPGARLQARFDGQDGLLPLLLQPGRVDEPCDGVRPGSLRTDKKGLCVACADCWYRLLVVRPQGRKDMEAAAFVNGHLRPAQHGVCGMAVPFGE